MKPSLIKAIRINIKHKIWPNKDVYLKKGYVVSKTSNNPTIDATHNRIIPINSIKANLKYNL